jgi:single-strand DNA-binding protein
MMFNKVIQLGRVTKALELRATQDGTPVTSFNIAVNRDFTNANGEREADFLPVVVWKKQAENCCKFLKKGSLVMVEGRLQSRSYQGQDGKKVYVVEIVADSVKFMDPPPAQQQNNQSTNQSSKTSGQHESNGQQPNNGRHNHLPSDDEDPFANQGRVIENNSPWPFA